MKYELYLLTWSLSCFWYTNILIRELRIKQCHGTLYRSTLQALSLRIAFSNAFNVFKRSNAF